MYTYVFKLLDNTQNVKQLAWENYIESGGGVYFTLNLL